MLFGVIGFALGCFVGGCAAFFCFALVSAAGRRDDDQD